MGMGRKGRQGLEKMREDLHLGVHQAVKLSCTSSRLKCKCQEMCLFWILLFIHTHVQAVQCTQQTLTQEAGPVPLTQLSALL